MSFEFTKHLQCYNVIKKQQKNSARTTKVLTVDPGERPTSELLLRYCSQTVLKPEV